MIEARRRAYLEALGLEVWVARPPAPEPGGLVVGPDPGAILLVCGAPEESATRIAGDVVRALGRDVTWAWPATGGDAESIALADAIADRLITRVIVFGREPLRWLFRGEVPQVLGSATLAAAPGLDELASSGRAKRAVWRLLQEPPGVPAEMDAS